MFGHRRAVDGDERPRGPRAARVDGLRHELLARPALSRDEDRRVGVRDALDEVVGLGHLRRGAHHLLEGRGALEPEPEAPDLGSQRALLDAAVERHREVVEVEGLRHVVVRAGADGRDGGVHAPEGGHDDDRDEPARLSDAGAEIRARGALHLEVRQDDVHVVFPGVEESEGFGRRLREGRAVVPLRELSVENRAEARIVVDHQDMLLHRALQPTPAPSMGCAYGRVGRKGRLRTFRGVHSRLTALRMRHATGAFSMELPSPGSIERRDGEAGVRQSNRHAAPRATSLHALRECPRRMGAGRLPRGGRTGRHILCSGRGER